MTPFQTHPRSAHGSPEAGGPQVSDDMTVEVALAVMASARTGHLIVCDADGLRTGRVTRAELLAIHEGDTYTDRVRLRDRRSAALAPAAGL
ncbi:MULTISPECIES: CBS domain-containing protein [unclassified Streptomyces]|uniref:CBS domain-containing protein n=1 Tax=unclassified Streptomyces TaxID=2593676 RepID=UPI003318D6AA